MDRPRVRVADPRQRRQKKGLVDGSKPCSSSPQAYRWLGAFFTKEGLSYGPPWAHYLSGYQDRLLGGPLGLPDLRCTVPDGVKHKDYRGEVLG
jgi:hypothetical protein